MKNHDFEHAWLIKLSGCLDEIAGEKVRKKVMAGSGGLCSNSAREDVIDWSKHAMERLNSLVDSEKRKRIMTGCA